MYLSNLFLSRTDSYRLFEEHLTYCKVGCRCESAVDDPKLSGVPGPCVSGVGIVSMDEKESELPGLLRPDTPGLTSPVLLLLPSLLLCESRDE